MLTNSNDADFPSPVIDLDDLVDEIARSFEHKERSQIREIALEEYENFRGATISTYIPIFLRQRLLHRLRSE